MLKNQKKKVMLVIIVYILAMVLASSYSFSQLPLEFGLWEKPKGS